MTSCKITSCYNGQLPPGDKNSQLLNPYNNHLSQNTGHFFRQNQELHCHLLAENFPHWKENKNVLKGGRDGTNEIKISEGRKFGLGIQKTSYDNLTIIFKFKESLVI